MRLLVVHPGSTVSTHDVYVGVAEALKRRGHEVVDYALDGRIEVSGAYLTYAWNKTGGKKGPIAKPSTADILYHAGEPLVARALRVQPDWVVIISGMYLHPDVLVLLRRAGLKVAILFTEAPYDDVPQAKILPWVDLAWTNERSSADGTRVIYMPHALNAALHQPGPHVGDEAFASHDVVFVGTGFQERIDTLAAVDWTGIDLGLYGTWDLLGSRHHLRQFIKGGYQENAQTAALYRRAKIGLNLYRKSRGFGRGAPQIDRAESLNPRAYELAATGCFTISDHRQEVSEKFGELVPTFTSPAELAAQVRRWLADGTGRARVRAALPGCVTDDTWDHRAVQMDSDLHRVSTGANDAFCRPVVAAGGS